MTLKVTKKFKYKGVEWISGHAYRFKYNAWMTDPNPLVILLYKFSGTHPTTGRQWRFIQAINVNYIPRRIREDFIKSWYEKLESSDDVYLTWEYVKQRYPNVVKSDALRRYFYSPNYYLTKVEAIPLENMVDVVVGSLAKDLSRKMKFSVIKKFRQMNKQSSINKKAAERSREIKAKNTDIISNILKKIRGLK